MSAVLVACTPGRVGHDHVPAVASVARVCPLTRLAISRLSAAVERPESFQ